MKCTEAIAKAYTHHQPDHAVTVHCSDEDDGSFWYCHNETCPERNEALVTKHELEAATDTLVVSSGDGGAIGGLSEYMGVPKPEPK